MRAPILDTSLTVGTVDLASFDQQLSTSKEHQTSLSFDDLFPDLTAYGGPSPPQEGHAPKYRLEEGHLPHHRPAHTSRIMDLEPIFVSTLQPARNMHEGSWDLQDGPWYEDPRGSADIPPEVVAASSSIFHGRTARLPGFHQSAVPKPSAHHLRAGLVWTPEEDKALEKLVMMYPYNWQLVTDSFNSEMVTIPTEKRLPYDCFERWDLTFGPDADKKREAAAAQAAAAAAKAQEAGASTGAAPTAPPSGNATPANGNPSSVPPATPMTANQPGQPPAIAVPTLPNQTNAEGGPSEAPPPPGLSKREAKAAARNKYEGTKKAIRHQALYDSVRRLIRRRETTKQKTNSEWNYVDWIVRERS